MKAEEISARLEAVIPNLEVYLDGEDCSFSAILISPHFEGMNLLSRQKLAMSALSDLLQTGELHAVSFNAYTPDEYNQKDQHLVQIDL